MQLKVLLVCGFLICIISSAPRRFNDEGSNYIMIGNSKDNYNQEEDEKNQRGYAQSYPIMLHNRPTSAYQGYEPSYTHTSLGPSYTPNTSLVSANIHLLEPFMLVTFLLFVLSLVDRARIPSLISRNDIAQEVRFNESKLVSFDVDHYRYPHHLFKMLGKHNQTDF